MRDFANALKIIDELLDSDAFDTPARIALMRQKSTYLLQTNDAKQALATLQQASAAADANLRDEIDTDIAFLLRESDRDAAQKLLDALSQRGVKSEKMTLLTATFDIDEKRYDDAEAKLTSLIRPDEPLAIAALEKLILLKQNRGDDDAQIREVARQLAETPSQNKSSKASHTPAPPRANASSLVDDVVWGGGSLPLRAYGRMLCTTPIRRYPLCGA